MTPIDGLIMTTTDTLVEKAQQIVDTALREEPYATLFSRAMVSDYTDFDGDESLWVAVVWPDGREESDDFVGATLRFPVNLIDRLRSSGIDRFPYTQFVSESDFADLTNDLDDDEDE